MEDKIVTNIYLSKSYPKICEEPGKSIKKFETDSKNGQGVPLVVQQLTNPTRIHKDVGLIPDLIQWVKDLALPWAVV